MDSFSPQIIVSSFFLVSNRTLPLAALLSFCGAFLLPPPLILLLVHPPLCQAIGSFFFAGYWKNLFFFSTGTSTPSTQEQVRTAQVQLCNAFFLRAGAIFPHPKLHETPLVRTNCVGTHYFHPSPLILFFPLAVLFCVLWHPLLRFPFKAWFFRSSGILAMIISTPFSPRCSAAELLRP